MEWLVQERLVCVCVLKTLASKNGCFGTKNESILRVKHGPPNPGILDTRIFHQTGNTHETAGMQEIWIGVGQESTIITMVGCFLATSSMVQPQLITTLALEGDRCCQIPFHPRFNTPIQSSPGYIGSIPFGHQIGCEWFNKGGWHYEFDKWYQFPDNGCNSNPCVPICKGRIPRL